MEVARAGTDVEITRRHGFEIVVEHVGLSRHHGFQRTVLAQEVRRQDLDAGTRALFSDRTDGLGKMFRTAIGEIVAIYRGDNDVGKPELESRLRDVLRLVWVERTGHAGFYVTEGAGTGAGIAHKHESGVLLVPALADIWTTCFLADRNQPVFPDDIACLGITAGGRRSHTDPGRFRR